MYSGDKQEPLTVCGGSIVKTGMWSVPLAMLVVSATCRDPGTVDPVIGHEDVDPWDGTAWAALFQEAREVGGRATIAPFRNDGGFQVLPVDPDPVVVLTDPPCSVPGDPSDGEVGTFVSCMSALARETDTPNPAMNRRYAFRVRPNRLLTWEEDVDVWRVWQRLTFECGEGFEEAQRDGAVRMQ